MIVLMILLCWLSFIVGCFVAAHIYSKRNATVLRLKNINRVAQRMLDGDYEEGGELAALSFILCESNLSLRKEKK